MEPTKIAFSLVEHGTTEWMEAVKLRELVLRAPLGSCFTKEELDAERLHTHVVGTLENCVVATAVLVSEGKSFKMQRVAVKEDLRNTGVGTLMMTFCELYARNLGVTEIYCHARDSAVAFYLRNEYWEIGAYFLEDGIPHVRMAKDIKAN